MVTVPHISVPNIMTTLKEAVFKYPVPPKTFFDDASTTYPFSPDKWRLAQYKRVWLFVYGEEMSMFQENNVDLLDYFDPVFSGITFQNYAMWKHNLGERSYPIVLDKKLDVEDVNWFKITHPALPHVKIRGECYLVPPRIIFYLDKYRENGLKYIRQRAQILLPYRAARYMGVPLLTDFKAWMYVGNPDYWEGQINGGGAQHKIFSPVQTFVNTNVIVNPKRETSVQYYHFTKKELLPSKSK